MGRASPRPACLPPLAGSSATRAVTLTLLVVLLAVAPTRAAATGEGEWPAEHAAAGPIAADARRLLYPRWDAASGLAGEPFRSPSLGLEAADMRLADFQVARVPDAAHRSIVVAAALLEPQGFPAPYTLLEVAVMEHGAAGLRLLDNLKVRVDSGSGPAGLRMRLQPPGRQPPGRQPPGRQPSQGLRFEVRVTDVAGSLLHRFRHDRDGIALLESIIAR